jgi:hypothetical protein
MDTNPTRANRKDTHQRLDILLPYRTYHRLITLSKKLNMSQNKLMEIMIDSYSPDIPEKDTNETLKN